MVSKNIILASIFLTVILLIVPVQAAWNITNWTASSNWTVPVGQKYIDVFCVGGGGSGYQAGGAGGWANFTNLSVVDGDHFMIVMGHAVTGNGIRGERGYISNGTKYIGNVFCNGGNGAEQPNPERGGPGGSGGGGAGGNSYGPGQGGSGGSNGANGEYNGGAGQLTTTREFGGGLGEDLYAGGGGGYVCYAGSQAAGGAGGGGAGGALNGCGTSGTNGFGGGGGGAYKSGTGYCPGGGGSGFISIRGAPIVETPNPPVAAFTCSPLVMYKGCVTACVNTDPNTPTDFRWYAPDAIGTGEGYNYTTSSAWLNYTSGGYKSVCHIASNNGGDDTECKPAYIYVKKYFSGLSTIFPEQGYDWSHPCNNKFECALEQLWGGTPL
jgi:hypothetical protein